MPQLAASVIIDIPGAYYGEFEFAALSPVTIIYRLGKFSDYFTSFAFLYSNVEAPAFIRFIRIGFA